MFNKPKLNELTKAMIENRKQYLALQFEIFRFQLKGDCPLKEIVETARKLRTAVEKIEEQVIPN